MAKSNNSIRIISGNFRGRKLPVADIEGLRPTGDRVKEVLFNWLQFEIVGKRVIDLFAGSGSLGFEALSRGAAKVVLVERSFKAFKQLQSCKEKLKVSDLEIRNEDAEKFLSGNSEIYDIAFLDPPFQQELLQTVFDSVQSHIKIGGYIYCEMEKSQEIENIPDNFKLIKHKTVGRVKINLFTKIS